MLSQYNSSQEFRKHTVTIYCDTTKKTIYYEILYLLLSAYVLCVTYSVILLVIYEITYKSLLLKAFLLLLSLDIEVYKS